MQQIPEDPPIYSEQNYPMSEHSLHYQQNGTKIFPRQQSVITTKLFLQVILLLLSIIYALGIAITYNFEREGLLVLGSGISLVGANILFFFINRRSWVKKQTQAKGSQLTLTFVSAFLLIVCSALSTLSLAAVMLLLSIWFGIACINIAYFAFMLHKELKSRG